MIHKALEKDRNRRYQLASEIRANFERLKNGVAELLAAGKRELLNAKSITAEVERLSAESVVVKLSGSLILGTKLREIEITLNRIADGGIRKLILDLSDIHYADSARLGLLVVLHGKMKTLGGRLRLVAPGKQLPTLFESTNTNSILCIDPDRDSALSG